MSAEERQQKVQETKDGRDVDDMESAVAQPVEATAMVESSAALEEQKRLAKERATLRRRSVIASVLGLVFSGVALLSIAAVGRSSLVEQRAEVDAKRSRVVEVIGRRNLMLAELEGADLALAERWGELSLSEDNIALEKRHYDDAATEYNRRVATFSGALGASFFGQPKHMELSNEIVAW